MGHPINLRSGDERSPVTDQAPPHETDTSSLALETVLESECLVLLALETSRERMRSLRGDLGSAEADIGGAIELLHHAITELRGLARASPASLLALGFVAGEESGIRSPSPGATPRA